MSVPDTEKSCQRYYLDNALARLEVEDEMSQLLRSPYREIKFEIPLHRDDGSLAVFNGYRVQHNQSRGPFKGGLRFHPDNNLAHFRDLASIMTWKTAVVNIPFGGAKGGINCDVKSLNMRELETLTKAFTERLIHLIGPDRDIPAPDMGTSERDMAWIYEAFSKHHGHEWGVVTGKPLQLGGCPGRIEATGNGVSMITGWAATEKNIDIDGAKIAIQGFGNVGRQTALSLCEKGAKIVAISDGSGGLYRENGLPIEELAAEMHKQKQKKGKACKLTEIRPDFQETLTNEELLGLDVDILIPAAVSNVINEINADAVKADLIIEAANAPLSCQASESLEARGVRIVPDILANAGGVVVSYLEWVQNHQRYQWNREKVASELEKIMRHAWKMVQDYCTTQNMTCRGAAYLVAVQRVVEATRQRGFI